MRGYFEIGVFQPKHEENVGTLWRSAFQLGAAGIFVIGKRWKRQASDTYKSFRHIPLREFTTFENLLSARPHGAMLVAVEMGGPLLHRFTHPQQAVYLLGSEDGGLPTNVKSRCELTVSIESVRYPSFNVATAGAIVMYDRLAKNGCVKDAP